MVFDQAGGEVAKHQLEHTQILPRSGRVEHDPVEIWERTEAVIQHALRHGDLSGADLAAIGITNQRETTVVWDPPRRPSLRQRDRVAGHPHRLHRRGPGTLGPRRRDPPQVRPAAGHLLLRRQDQWILENVNGVREAAEKGHAVFGTTDCWVLWNLTGGPHGGVHATDVTNASRTMLMDLETLDWDDELLGFFGIPRAMLPTHRGHRLRGPVAA
ncbi:FGGY family carbohydrate kinase [Streptomyces sp. ME109]